MRTLNKLTFIFFGCGLFFGYGAPNGCAQTQADYPVQPVPFNQVRLAPGFWASRLETNRLVTIPFAFQKCEETGRIDNFAVAGKLKEGTFRGIRYDDSDVFKVIEGAAYSLANRPDPQLDAYLDDLIRKVAAAQEPDGYLFTIRTILGDSVLKKDRAAGQTRFSYLEGSHELYNVGHLYEAAVAHHRATGKRTLLDVATKNADYLLTVFGPGKLIAVPGHEEIELGLVKLYRVTGKRAYLDLAQFFVDMRGRKDLRTRYIGGHNHFNNKPTRFDSLYFQDLVPLTQQTEIDGHAVRAGYFYAGATDVDAVMGQRRYRAALDKLWNNASNQKMYLTGGVGAHRSGENFGANYELPNESAYAETCAAVAMMLWGHRMFLLTGDGGYLDIFERALYNGFLVGVSLEGNRFFYPNPLASDGVTKFNGEATRVPWFGTSCCPTNVARVLPSLPGYVYATRGNEVLVNLLMAGTGAVPTAAGEVRIQQETNYPWAGHAKLTIDPGPARRFPLAIRIPGWARNQPVPGDLYRYADTPSAERVELNVNGKPVPYTVERGFARIERSWKKGDVVEISLPMLVRQVVAHPAVEANRGRVALERGPVVYCVEGADNGGKVHDLTLTPQTQLTARPAPDFLTDCVLIKASGPAGTRPFTAIPYHLWSHRGPNEMAVWLPMPGAN
jgi:DUF1680 family protein